MVIKGGCGKYEESRNGFYVLTKFKFRRSADFSARKTDFENIARLIV